MEAGSSDPARLPEASQVNGRLKQRSQIAGHRAEPERASEVGRERESRRDMRPVLGRRLDSEG